MSHRFYLLLAGDYESKDIVPLVTEMFTFIRDFHDEVPQGITKKTAAIIWI